jgi:uncharacterized protein (DUF58 family)
MRKILLVIVPLIILIVALTSEYLLLERLFILVMSLLVLSHLIARSGLWGLKGRLIQPSRYQQAGKAFLNEAAIENTNILPKSFLRLKINTNVHNSEKPTILINLAADSTLWWRLPFTFPCRGIYKIGPLIAQSNELDDEKEVLVCPSTIELPLFSLSPQQETNNFLNKRILSGSGTLIAGVRDYVIGDSMKRIHWPSSAHKGKLIVKEYDSEVNEKIWIFLDLDKNQQFGKGVETSEEYSIIIAASIFKKFSEAGQQVGLIAQGDQYFYHPPRTGSLNTLRVMESMGMMKADGRIPLSRIINRAYEQLDQNSTAVIITACVNDDLVESLIRIRRRGLKVTAILLDSLSFGGQFSADQSAKSLRSVDIPTHIVKKGADLGETLNSRRINVN